MEYDIIMFLHNNPHHNTAAEIVRIRKSTKSHVSSSLKKVGKQRSYKNENKVKIIKKHIEIVLLDDAALIVDAGLNAQKSVCTECFKRADRRRKACVYECI